MAIITDVEKLRPELKGVSDAELERRMTELLMEKERRELEARKAKVEGIVKQANDHMAAIVSAVTFLNEHNLLNEDVKQVYTSGSGVFAPHLKHKAVDADRVLARMGEAPVKRTRRKRAG